MPKPFEEQLLIYLQQKPADELAGLLASVISNNRELKKSWQAKLVLAGGKPSDFKKFLTKALPKKSLIGVPNMWAKTADYFSTAEELFALAFAELDSKTPPLDNEQQFAWLMQAFERLNRVLEAIDDSGGYRLRLEGELGKRLIACFHLLDWPVAQKAAWLVDHRHGYDVFPWIPDHFELTGELAGAYVQAEKGKAGGDNVSFELLDRLKQGVKQ